MTATEFLPVNGCLLHGMEAPIDLRVQKQSKVHCGGEACPDQGFQQLDVALARRALATARYQPCKTTWPVKIGQDLAGDCRSFSIDPAD